MIPATLWGHFSNPAELPIWKETEATSQHAALGQSGCQLCERDGPVTADANLGQAFNDGQSLRRSLVWTAWSPKSYIPKPRCSGCLQLYQGIESKYVHSPVKSSHHCPSFRFRLSHACCLTTIPEKEPMSDRSQGKLSRRIVSSRSSVGPHLKLPTCPLPTSVWLQCRF